VWRLEWQKRGAPHFHLLVLGVDFIHKEWIQAAWGEVIGFDRPFTNIGRARSWRGAKAYCSKYLAKSDSGLDLLPYQQNAGRVWGCFGVNLLPFAERFVGVSEVGLWFYELKRAFRRYMRGQGRVSPALRGSLRSRRGFTLFSEGALQWLSLAAYYGAALHQVP